MKIAIGTLNKAKNEAVQKVISKIWPEAEYFPTKTNSRIREQPLTDEEGIEGAINRAKHALELIPQTDYGIGLEGTVDTNKYGMFLSGWVAIVNREGEIGMGCSGKVLMPKYLEIQLNEGKELGPLVQEMLKDTNNEIRHSTGTNGLLTNNLYTRIDEFETATLCALAKFVSSEIYNKK